MNTIKDQGQALSLMHSREFLQTKPGEPGIYAVIRIDRVINTIKGTAYLEGYPAIKSDLDTPIPSGKNLVDLTRDIHQFLSDSLIRGMIELQESIDANGH